MEILTKEDYFSGRISKNPLLKKKTINRPITPINKKIKIRFHKLL